MSAIDKITATIADEMVKFEPYFRKQLKSKVPLFGLITNYIIRRKGKQMRPAFVFLSAKLHGETNRSSHTAAAMIELLHTATLIHDDVVDEAYERRGFFSINALWKNKIAVLTGDFLLAKGLLLAVEEKEFDLLKIVSDSVQEMSEGELLQIEKSRKLNITEEVYFEIIRKKTATLISSCCGAGAKSAGADDKTVERMMLFGKYVGIAFQIKDDIFDYQSKNLIGKPTGNDIKEKKLTLPLIHVLNNVSSSDKKKYLRIINRHNNNSKKVKEVIDFVTKNGGIDYSHTKMIEYKQKALDILSEFPDSKAKQSLSELVEYTTERKI